MCYSSGILEYSDDTAMMRCVAQSLLTRMGFDEQDMARRYFSEIILSVLKAIFCSFLCLMCVYTCFCFTFNTVLQKSIASLQTVVMDQESFMFCESLRHLSLVTSFSQHVLNLVGVAHLAMEEQWELHPLPLPSEMLLMWGGWGPGYKSYFVSSVATPSWCTAYLFLKSLNKIKQWNM